MSTNPHLVLGDDDVYRLARGDGALVPVCDPFATASQYLREPRSDPTWRTLTCARFNADRGTYGVFLYSPAYRALHEWQITAEGEFIDHRHVPLAELGRLIPLDELAPALLSGGVGAEFGPALLAAGGSREARALALKEVRRGIDVLEAFRFLTAAYAAEGMWTRARIYLARLQRESARRRTVTDMASDLADDLFVRQFRTSRRKASILYLFQSPGLLRDELAQAVLAAGAEYICLTFNQQRLHPRYVFQPGTTWSQGRNYMADLCKAQIADYDYYVFCDHDIFFSNVSLDVGLRRFNTHLLSKRPEVATPAQPWHPAWGPLHQPDIESCEVAGFDAQFNAFRRDVLTDGILFPMIESLDPLSWYVSQSFMIPMCRTYYSVLQFNDLHVAGLDNSAYPKNPDSGQTGLLFSLLTGRPPPGECEPAELRRFYRSFFNSELRDKLYKNPIYTWSR